ncbi:hypothetical protein WJX81_004185 [Elliptochloris bilobata]|uniref:Peptidase S1 domain-containing protein n=1 Tax=Elliptochloris bilobata TaxID=381761 RepID=A0AAW1R1C0_9CHLO
MITAGHCVFKKGKYTVTPTNKVGGIACCNPVGIDYPAECDAHSRFNIVNWVAFSKYIKNNEADDYDMAIIEVASTQNTDKYGVPLPWGSIAASEPSGRL